MVTSLNKLNNYVGRFAPSPTGALHMGSLVAAMASYLDAKAHDGKWLLRIEDLDFDRDVKGADLAIIELLCRCKMQWNDAIEWQSQRTHLYETAFRQLAPMIYPCSCSRKEIADSRRSSRTSTLTSIPNSTSTLPSTSRFGLVIYPGTCRAGLANNKPARAWRLRVPDEDQGLVTFTDRWLGEISQNIATEAGDFVLKRADGFWAYQLAVVVDDAAQGVTHVVRGDDLLDSTPRQIYLQDLLGLPHVQYLHIPVVANANGDKLSKQTGAQAIDVSGSERDVLRQALLPAAELLGLKIETQQYGDTLEEFWHGAVTAWRQLLEQRERIRTESEPIWNQVKI
ncbi:glutamyl-Q tRNA(Asp) synthetase [Undibacterium sp. GrIS 1.8]|uniref:tRNA glutamyl-Q(34) synthetase GluQRS n=1 Tax=unclassified Undibacterium TaxID=2630295 RepID=UPI003392526B